MPSAEETTYLIEVMPADTTQDFLSRDVDLLVSRIKENLRLSGFKAKSSVTHRNRPSPYRIPSRSWAEPGNCEVCATRNRSLLEQRNRHRHSQQQQQHCHHHHHRKQENRSTRDDDDAEEEDPYELLQELLREGGLIKEAVKRLQANLEEFERSEDDELDEEELDDEVVDGVRERSTGTFYRRKPYFYDSEDEPLPSVYESLKL